MLKLENVKKSYDGTTVLDGINLEIEDGEIVSILGPSGCGKTTLLNLILGITDIDSGKIIYNGEDLTGCPMENEDLHCISGLCIISKFKCLPEHHLRIKE